MLQPRLPTEVPGRPARRTAISTGRCLVDNLSADALLMSAYCSPHDMQLQANPPELELPYALCKPSRQCMAITT